MEDETIPTEITALETMKNQVCMEFVIATIRLSCKNAEKLKLGRCKIENLN